MTRYYCHDRGAGERELMDTLEEALAAADESIKAYRSSARHDGEWMLESEDVTVGIVAESGDEEDDVATHSSRLVGDDEEGYECFMRELGAPEKTSVPGPSI